MSEYQYYEFLAVDRPLDEDEQSEVRELSTRAEVTATGFVNEYEGGDFKGDPDEMMALYYDAHLYWANRGARRLMLRLPEDRFPPHVARRYRVDEYADVRVSGDHVVLDFHSDDEPGEDAEQEVPTLERFLGLREELAAGDLRPLYLAWLAAFGTWERDEDAFGDEAEDVPEPPVPAGLGALTAPQRALADLLRVDDVLLDVAAQAGASPASDDSTLTEQIEALPVRDKDALLLQLARGHSARASFDLLDRLGASTAGRPEPRTVGRLLDAAAQAR